MLVLSRKIGERLVIGDNVSVVVSRVCGNRVTLGVEAPQQIKIVRGEIDSQQQIQPKESSDAKGGWVFKDTTMTDTEQTTAQKILSNVQRLASWLELHPDIEPLHVTCGSVHVAPQIHLTKADLKTVAGGLAVERRSSADWWHFYVTIDGIEFTACEQTSPERKQVTL